MPSWIQSVLNTCPLAAKFKGDRLPIPAELGQLPYFQKRFKNKYAHLYKAHDERGLKCPMDVKTMEDIVSFCQHVLRSDDIVRSTKDVARVFLARVLNVYNAQNPVRGSMDEDIFDQTGHLKNEGSKTQAQAQAQPPIKGDEVQEKSAAPALAAEQTDELEAAAMRLSVDQDRRRMRRLERHIVKLEARLTLLEPDSDEDSNSPGNTGPAKPSLDVVRDIEKERNLTTGVAVARTGSAATSGAHTRTPSSGLTRNESGATANSNGAVGKEKDKDKDVLVREKERDREKMDRDGPRDKDLREAKILLREMPIIKKLGRGTTSPSLRTPPQLRTPPPPPALR
ncbi:hypothetical protein CcaverHIS002_0503670 [Cutaneotrichosporon cavernicola]|uniref:Uncharacterized protein n=1 Tax=Cutaneotrichosporon cavernicola TaxID=279322 RepID=A0AA48L689_9TREE|nr:uncharacterized protein CcaverHIS019_0504240 [Cutaneotrichosporon cavernicola]BEI84966.1 hypothetical protein CcaverHIS002_0503670 [Cutaneotrichosporon cavernicola]BEI92796.1 hypothetical protein CcaverHIS019_0504240 [Cutaneotrichosporon cavernicola]BEJ00572.1 hypothetical protein CcaverHIS631_0504290 [Cutaneotrichosporon cavernicola]BEJ08340.1 hypothetical protein CcaverHIS641_0504250 [Cutaneotrichosporon cavernicola]